jgi:hypothetical protein
MRLTIEIDTRTAVRLTEAAVADRRPIPMQAAVELERALSDRQATALTPREVVHDAS